MKDNKDNFNLLNEKWIPLQDGLVSLRDVFSSYKLPNLAGNPIEKISLMKLLLAITHSAYTPENHSDWEKLTLEELSAKVIYYLRDKDELFNLYGDAPFLQMPAVKKAKKKNISILQPYIVPNPSNDSQSTNTTVLTEIQREIKFSDPEKAVLLIQNLNFALGGKKVDNKVSLTPGYKKGPTAKPGYSLGNSYLHSMVLGKTLLESIYLNLLTKEQINSINTIKQIGKPPWEVRPTGEDCPIAKELKESYMGMLVPFSRFMLISGDYVHYTEGFYPNGYDLTVGEKKIDSKNEINILKANPEKKPWRELDSLLSFIEATSNSSNNYNVPLLKFSIEKITKSKKIDEFIVYSGGLKVSKHAGENFVTGNCDFVESEVPLKVKWLEQDWFKALKRELEDLNEKARELKSNVKGFHKEFKASSSESIAQKAVNTFWQKCETKFINLIDALGENNEDDLNNIRKKISSYMYECYDNFCHNTTARQMEIWIKHRNFQNKRQGGENGNRANE